MNEQIIHLDVSKRPAASQTVRIGQGDVGGTTIVAKLYDNDSALDLTGKSVRFMMRQPGGEHYVRDTNVETSGNTATYVVDESHVASLAGSTDSAYFDVMVGSTVISSTQRFRIEVLRSAMDGAAPAETWDNAIDELIERGEQAIEDVEESSITSAAATIDANVGTPSVEVSLGEKTSLGRLISFAFHNIKGAKGDKGDKGDKGNTGDPGTVTPITTAQIDDVVSDASVTSDNALTATGLTYLWGKLKAAFAAISHNHAAGDITSGTLGVARGGTGAATHTTNAVLTGDGTNAVKNVATADGALYATGANVAAQFGTLPVAQGGTAGTTKTEARQSLEVPANSSIAPVESVTATANHAIGDYFMLGDVLMVATSAIATGETINTSNAMTATIQSQIDAIRDSLVKGSWDASDGVMLRCGNGSWIRFRFDQDYIIVGTDYRGDIKEKHLTTRA